MDLPFLCMYLSHLWLPCQVSNLTYYSTVRLSRQSLAEFMTTFEFRKTHLRVPPCCENESLVLHHRIYKFIWLPIPHPPLLLCGHLRLELPSVGNNPWVIMVKVGGTFEWAKSEISIAGNSFRTTYTDVEQKS